MDVRVVSATGRRKNVVLRVLVFMVPLVVWIFGSTATSAAAPGAASPGVNHLSWNAFIRPMGSTVVPAILRIRS
jgi:hypothetical protein